MGTIGLARAACPWRLLARLMARKVSYLGLAAGCARSNTLAPSMNTWSASAYTLNGRDDGRFPSDACRLGNGLQTTEAEMSVCRRKPDDERQSRRTAA